MGTSGAGESTGLLGALSEAVATGSAAPLLAAETPARLRLHLLSRESKAVCTLGASKQLFRVVFLQTHSVSLLCYSWPVIIKVPVEAVCGERYVSGHLPSLCRVRVHRPKLLRS